MVESIKVSLIESKMVVHVWLILFMTGVGLLKATGKLPHRNSKAVGILELIGGLVFLPGWAQVQEVLKFSDTNMYLTGCFMILVGLGIVTADLKKRLSPVCWIHAALVWYFLLTLKLEPIIIRGYKFDALLIAPIFFFYGNMMGRLVGKDLEVIDKKKKP